MKELTQNNHFKFGYDYKWFSYRETADDNWMVKYGACERSVKDFKEECYATASLIRDIINEPLTLLFSGGADSEVVLRAFHDQGIPFKVAICQFSNNLNIHDLSYAVVCCEQLGIKYDLIQLNILKFFESEMYEYAKRSQSQAAQLCTTMWLADQVDGVPILGSGECYVVKEVPPDYVDGVSPYISSPWHLYEKEMIASWYRHFIVQDRMAVPGFFQYNPELMLSFLLEDRVVNLVNDRLIGKRSTLSSKFNIYEKHFPLIKRKKYNGFEFLTEYTNRIYNELKHSIPASGAVYMTEYNDVVNMLEGRIEGPKGILRRNFPIEN